MHQGRVVATDERRYALRHCPGTLDVGPDRLTIQGADHDNGRPRRPVAIERADVVALHLRRGWFGAKLSWENASGYRNLVIRVREGDALLADLVAQGWPVVQSGRR